MATLPPQASPPPTDPSTSTEPNEITSSTYLTHLLNSPLRIHTTDARIFVGDFKCTDSECNIILARTFEYRHPSPSKLQSAASTIGGSDNLKLDMTSRFLGLVVVPGQYITRIEVEERVESESESAKTGARPESEESGEGAEREVEEEETPCSG